MKKYLLRELIFLIIWISMWYSLEVIVGIHFSWPLAIILIITVSLIRFLDSVFQIIKD